MAVARDPNRQHIPPSLQIDPNRLSQIKSMSKIGWATQDALTYLDSENKLRAAPVHEVPALRGVWRRIRSLRIFVRNLFV
jgi:hypothetical protein